MNKTVTANISGVVFHIEAQAYEQLHQYLNTIRNYFKDSDGKDEIMDDIEARIAELLKENLVNGQEVITGQHVQSVIEVMGEPEQYMDEEAQEEFSTESGSSSSGRNFKSKRLFRDPDDPVIGGVCSGLGYYFGIDRIWFRAAFLIALFGFGTGILLYIILWIIIPDAKSASDKLEMKGEPINVQNIGNTIKDEFQGFKKKVDGDGQYGRKAENAIFRFFDFLTKIIVYFFKFIVKLIAAIFILVAVVSIFSFIVVLINGPIMMEVNDYSIQNQWGSDFAELFFSSPMMYSLCLIGSALVVLIPMLGLLYGGLKILFKIPSSSKAVSISAASLWVIGLILLAVSITSTVANYSNEQRVNETIVLDELPSDTLNLVSYEDSYSTNLFGNTELYIEDEFIRSNEISVNVIKTMNENIELKVVKRSQGKNRREAGMNAENVFMTYEVAEKDLKISPFVSFPKEDRFRRQRIRVSIALPVGKSIYLDPSSREIIYDIENVTNTYDGRMMGHTWLMTDKGLECTDCAWMVEEENEEETDELENETNTQNDENEIETL